MLDWSKLYLTIILGDVDVTLKSADQKYTYKKDYETFKVRVTYVLLSLLVAAYIFPNRFLDSICNFLMVWYYCTLTIREAVLRVNGSRIKGWWILHHYIACVLCAITLTWRDCACYQEFRPLYFVISIYIGILQIFQSSYQVGCLRRLRALGERHEMDITLEGFSGWMFKGLTFLLPFLVFGYLIQAYCSFKLFSLYWISDCNEDWHVLALAFLFALVAAGNFFTLLFVFIRKVLQKSDDLSHLATKYQQTKSD